MTTPPSGYTPTAKTLHWVTAFGAFAMVPVGLYMVRRGARTNFDDLTNSLYSGHKLAGFVLFWVIAARILYRLKGAPPPAETLTPAERILSAAVHHLLYILLPLVPLLGWLGVSAYGARDIFDWFSLPPLLPESSWGETILKYHAVAAITLAALACLHIAGALMHGVVKQDGVMNRMIGWWPLRK